MNPTDWAAARMIWKAVKESGLEDDFVVYVGTGPDGSLDILVESMEDLSEDIGTLDEVEHLMERVRTLEAMLHPAYESSISPYIKVLPRET